MPAATHLLVFVVLLRHSFGVWSVILFGLWSISLVWEMHRRWPRIGHAIAVVLPDSPLPYGRTDPPTREVVRVRWSLPRWLSVELISAEGREVVDIFSSEMAAHELAMLRRWAQLDKLLRRGG